MNVHPFCYVCPRDWELFCMLRRSWMRLGRFNTWVAFYDRREKDFVCSRVDGMFRPLERPDGFHPWSGWQHAMSKLEGWRQMVSQPDVGEDDYILYCDSDTHFFTDEILGQLEGHDFIGFPHSEYSYAPGLAREWSWLSGCFQAARAGVVREVVNLQFVVLEKVRQELLDGRFSHNEDVVMSYLFARVGARENRLDPARWCEPRVEDALLGRATLPLKSFAHMQYGECVFAGQPIKGKWEIPAVLAKAGMSL